MPSSFKAVCKEFRVNTYTDSDQQSPNVAANPATGGFQVVWQSDGQDGFFWGVYAQNFDAQGNAVGDEIEIADIAQGDQESPDVAINENGEGMWVWQTTVDYTLSGTPTTEPTSTTFPAANYRVVSKIFGFQADSGQLYTPYEVEREGGQDPNAQGDDLIDISVHSLGGQRFLTAWYSKDETRDEYNFSVEAINIDTKVSIDPTGEVSYAPSEPFGSTNWGDVALWRTVADRRFGNLEEYLVVSSRSGSADASGGVIQFQVFQQNAVSDLAFLFDTRLPTDYNDQYVLEGSGLNGAAMMPHLAVLDDGGFAITWQEMDDSEGTSDVWVQIFNDDLSERTGVLAVHDASDDDQTGPEIVTTKDGGFAIVYTDGSGADGDGTSVMVQRFDEKGVRLGEAYVANSTTDGDQSGGAIDRLENGNLVVTWESENGDGTKDVHAQLLDLESNSAKAPQYLVGTDAKKEKFNTKAKDDYVDGAGGKDIIKTGTGNDTALGGDGNDKINGGTGEDLIDGGAGKNKLTGGDDADMFLFAEGKSRIMDFEPGVDEVMFDKSLGGSKGLSKKTIKNFVTEEDDALVFDFGRDELTIDGVSSYRDIADDIGFA